ncbi:MAG: ArsC/Spx/MgsR family protein [Spirochaetota bacterium]
MPTIFYHNPKCSKSRETLKLLQEKQIPFETYEYQKQGLSSEQIKNLMQRIDVPIAELVRAKDLGKHSYDLNDSQTIEKLLLENPKLLARPIVDTGSIAIQTRPPEKVLRLLK